LPSIDDEDFVGILIQSPPSLSPSSSMCFRPEQARSRVYVHAVLDSATRISAFGKLKLTNCAPISGLPRACPGSLWCRAKVGQVNTRISAGGRAGFYQHRVDRDRTGGAHGARDLLQVCGRCMARAASPGRSIASGLYFQSGCAPEACISVWLLAISEAPRFCCIPGRRAKRARLAAGHDRGSLFPPCIFRNRGKGEASAREPERMETPTGPRRDLHTASLREPLWGTQ
jgi:hypothetical protein